MTPNERREFIRARFSGIPATKATAKPQGQYRSTHADMPAHPVRVRWVELPKAKGHGFVSCGPAIPRKVPVWATVADENEDALVPKIRRYGGASPLTTMVEPLLAKLPVLEPLNSA